MPTKEATELTSRQESFCQEYIKDYNGTRAAIRAKYSPKTAQEQASRLLSTVIIRGRINQLLEKQYNQIRPDVARVLKGLVKAAEIDIRMAYDADGCLLPIEDMPEPLAKAIQEIKTEELFDGHGKDREHIGTTKTLKLKDSLRGFELLGKHLKMFTDVMEVRGLEGLAERMRQADLRLKHANSRRERKS
jgi:phage terminase small subunit